MWSLNLDGLIWWMCRVSLVCLAVFVIVTFVSRWLRVRCAVTLPVLFLLVMGVAIFADRDSERLLLLVPGLLALPMSVLLPVLHPQHDILAGGYTIVGLLIVGPLQYFLVGLAFDRFLRRNKKKDRNRVNQPSDSADARP